MGNPFGTPCSVGDRGRSKGAKADQRKPLEAKPVNHRLQVRDKRFERVIADIAVGEPGTAAVVADEGAVEGQGLPEGAIHSASPLYFQVADGKRRRLDQRSATSRRAVCDVYAVFGTHESNRGLAGVLPGTARWSGPSRHHLMLCRIVLGRQRDCGV